MLSAVAKQIVVDGIVNVATRKSRTIPASLGFYALAGGIGIIGVVFLSIAIYGVLLDSFTMPVAATITGVGILVLSGLLVLIGKKAAGELDKRSLRQEAQQVDVVISQLMDAVIGEIEDPVRENPKMALALAGLAGLMVGGRIH